MRLADLEKMDAYLAVEKQLPSLFCGTRYIAYIKYDGNLASTSSTIFLGVGLAFLCICFGVVQSIFSLYFWEWFGVSRLTAMYIIALGGMLAIFAFVAGISNYVRGMSYSIDKSLSTAKYFIVVCFILVFILFTLFKVDDFAMLMTIELIAILVGLSSVFVEYGFDRTKINSEQFLELVKVRYLNLRLIKLRKKTNKINNVTHENVKELYEKSSKIEAELKAYFSE